MKSHAFWILDACVLFALSLLYLNQGYHRKNQLFTVWLCGGVLMQLVAAWGLAAGWPQWINQVRAIDDIVTYGLTVGVLALAILRRDCPVNRSLLWGLGGMMALNLFARYVGAGVPAGVQTWLRNIAFFGPAIFLLIAFSNLRLDRLPLRINSAIRTLKLPAVRRPAAAAVSLEPPSWLSPPAFPKGELREANPGVGTHLLYRRAGVPGLERPGAKSRCGAVPSGRPADPPLL